MELTNELENLGLSQKEARVYLANLELGQSSVQNIAQKAKVNRATTYVILDSLIKKGLCSTFTQDKKTRYVASDPELLEGMFEIQKRQIEERQKYFSSLLPQLKLIDNTKTDKPVVKFYEGKQGLNNCYNEFVNRFQPTKGGGAAYVFYPKDMVNELFSAEERQKYRKFRVDHDVPVKTIYTSDKVTMENTPHAVRFKVPMEDFPGTCDIGVHADSMRIVVLKKDKLSGILITDPDVCQTMFSVFKLAWEAAETRAANQLEPVKKTGKK